MIELINTKKGLLTLIIFNLILGVMVKYASNIVGLAYGGLFVLFLYDVIKTRDRDSRAGFYCLYMMGMEMVYRMVNAPIGWESGKYFSILILIVGMLAGRRNFTSWTFVLLLVLLIPSLILAENPDPVRLRKDIMFSLSGPLSLVFSGLYFYGRPINEDSFVNQLKFSFLPAITTCVALSLVSVISDIQYTSLQSNAHAAGGIPTNQASTMLGWFILLGLLLKLNRNKITPYEWLDWFILFYLFLRALLTFSRGGVMGAMLSIAGSVAVLYFSSHQFRLQIKKFVPYIFLGIAFLVGVFFIANQITNGMLLYRYRGISTAEMKAGIEKHEGSMLTGRNVIMDVEMQAFKDNPFWGLGAGMGASYREAYFGHRMNAHTEYTRLLSEHGTFGVLFILIGMIILPLSHFFKEKGMIARYFFIAFLLISMFTMFHAAMRMALPGIAFGASFAHIISKPKEKTNTSEVSGESNNK